MKVNGRQLEGIVEFADGSDVVLDQLGGQAGGVLLRVTRLEDKVEVTVRDNGEIVPLRDPRPKQPEKA